MSPQLPAAAVSSPGTTTKSSSRPILPQLDIPETGISTFTPFTSTPTTPTNKDNDNANTSPITVIKKSPITIILRAHSSRRSNASSNISSLRLPSPRFGQSIPRVWGTRVSDYDDSDDECEGGFWTHRWREEPEWPDADEGKDEDAAPFDADAKGKGSLGDFIMSEFKEAWWRNQVRAPRTEGDVRANLARNRRVMGDGVGDTMGRMGLRRVQPRRGGGGSPLREVVVAGVEVETAVSGKGKRYREARFMEVGLDDEGGVGRGLKKEEERAKGGVDGVDERSEREGEGKEKKRLSLRKKIWKRVKGWV
ncbi:MAG: hypothetical protein LQ338_004579 [Usnochroma carphineum]|nr:MAG: hypothetical protein LQ338_004579 [Usnochroma carphineum]